MKNARAAAVSFLLSLLTALPGASAAVAPSAVWQRELGESDAAAVFMTLDGNVASLGAYYTSPNLVPRLWKHSPAGALIWSVTPPNVFCPTGGVIGAGMDASGAIVAACNSTLGALVFKVNAAGELAWAKPLMTPSGYATVTGIAVAPSGEFYACGIHNDNLSGKDVLLVKFAADGNVAWRRTFDGPTPVDHHHALAVALAPGGGAVANGLTYVGPSGPVSMLTIWYEANGDVRWLKVAQGAGRGLAVIADATGNVTAGGSNNALNDAAEAVVVRYDAAGNETWVYRKGVTPPAIGGTELVSLAQDGTGRIAIGCRTRDQSNPPVNPSRRVDTLTAITPAGAAEWTVIFPDQPLATGSADFSKQGLYALAGLPEGGFVAGGGWRDGHRALGKVTGAGTLEWFKTVAPPLTKPVRVIKKLTLDAAGNIYTLADSDDLILERHGGAVAPGEPQPVTLAADQVAWNSARLNGKVNPAGFAVAAHFIYGPTISYGSATAPQNIPAGMEDIPFSTVATGLKGDTTYHFRLVAQGPGGNVTADDVTFTTPRSPYQNWAVEKMGSHTAPGTAPDEDFDQDGTSNFLELAFNGDPAVLGAVAGLPVPEMYRSPSSGVRYFSIVWEENPAATGVKFTPEGATNLAVWTGPVPAQGNITIETLPGNRKRAVAVVFQKFMRLRVTQTP